MRAILVELIVFTTKIAFFLLFIALLPYLCLQRIAKLVLAEVTQGKQVFFIIWDNIHFRVICLKTIANNNKYMTQK